MIALAAGHRIQAQRQSAALTPPPDEACNDSEFSKPVAAGFLVRQFVSIHGFAGKTTPNVTVELFLVLPDLANVARDSTSLLGRGRGGLRFSFPAGFRLAHKTIVEA